MSDPLQQALPDMLAYLMTLAQEGIRPEEARARLRQLQPKYPELKLDLLWEEEAYDHSIHYDVLLQLPPKGTISLSLCPDRALPWPLRGLHHWSEKQLVRVNRTGLTVSQAIAYLDFIWDESRITNRLIDVALIQETIDQDPVELSDAELQQAMDAFRRAHRLYRAEDTYQWMKLRGVTHEQLEQLVIDQATVAKLRDQITADRVEAYFEAHRSDFDRAVIARFEIPDEASARRICEQIQSGDVDFYEAAQRAFLSAPGSEHRSGELFATIQRGQVAPELVAAFEARVDEVVGPLRTEGGYAIMRLLSFTPARLDESTRDAIKKVLFEKWLAERRETATIEWFWGSSKQTAPMSSGMTSSEMPMGMHAGIS